MANPSAAFTALADPTRREIFERIAREPIAVGELADELPVSRPAVSQHLKVLKDAGLVIDRAEGTRRVYEIDPNGLGALRAWLDQFWGAALDAFKAEVERDEPPGRKKSKRVAGRRRRGVEVTNARKSLRNDINKRTPRRIK
jgi:DNA-binding transcriptional ArsR family regulator